LDRRTRSGRPGRLHQDIVAPTPALTAYILAWRIPSGSPDSVRPAEDGTGPYTDTHRGRKHRPYTDWRGRRRRSPYTSIRAGSVSRRRGCRSAPLGVGATGIGGTAVATGGGFTAERG
jgi:hypothetical protein